MAELIKQGAEGRIFRHATLGIPAVTKERFTKAYRHPALDAKLTKSRLLQEARALHRARTVASVDTPRVLFVDLDRMTLTMEEIPGRTARDWVVEHGEQEEHGESLNALCAGIGRAVAALHRIDLVHGDLTTSNLVVRNGDPRDLVVIDFGLATVTTLAEDKGVDLYVLERAIRSTHPRLERVMVDAILAAYEAEAGAALAKPVIDKLEEVRLRGRKRSMVG
ncbi:serine/threonine-protein kinase bud32 [Blastocladiella emersonii ATCC 22665]|nr:serine/threonine-protein kinase bud32 [Blastocladiella emersonii ATCC 22665]